MPAEPKNGFVMALLDVKVVGELKGTQTFISENAKYRQRRHPPVTRLSWVGWAYPPIAMFKIA
jgi:hypothetical protein